jgi:tight adherence protein B
MSGTLVLFLCLVFAAVFLLVQGLVVPAFGENARTRKLLRRRLSEIEAEAGEGSFVSLLRLNYLDELTPAQRFLEELPGMARLRAMIEQAGLTTRAWQVVVGALLFGLGAAVLAILLLPTALLALPAFAVGFAAPIARVHVQRRRRLDQFDQELPDAIDLIKRALRAGQPFTTAIRLVGEDMDGPVGQEFRATAADMNYGNDSRRALLGLLARVPSVALMGLVTAVVLQRETGGNLAEILERISSVIRGRYRFQRRVRTLSAEGRMSAWVLTLIPIGLSGLLSITSPDYLPVLFQSPIGHKILLASAVLMTLGILWMRRIIRIEF